MKKLPPRYKHQSEVMRRSKDKKAYAFLMEMGTAKTRPTIETAEHLFLKGEIEAMIVFAPNGVQRNWILNQVPLWCQTPYRAAWWQSNPNKTRAAALASVTARPFHGLRILAANYESCNSPVFKAYIKKFLRSFKTIFVLDESTRIKTPGIKRTKFIRNIGPMAPYRRILSGLVTPNSPFDLWAQFDWLDPNILGFSSFTAFKAHFAEIEDNKYLLEAIQKRNAKEFIVDEETGERKPVLGRAPMLVKKDKITGLPKYRNLDELNELIKDHSFRVLKDECLDLPKKNYLPIITVQLTDKQQHVYNSVRDGIISEFAEGEITAAIAIAKMGKLQQITGGFWKLDDETIIKPIDGKFPKLEVYMDLIEDVMLGHQSKVAIWTHYQHENRLIADALREAYGHKSVVQYYGEINNNNKQIAEDRFRNRVRDKKGNFQEEDTGCRFWVGEPHSGGIGLELIEASLALYYSNSFNLEDRLQSEDRHHRSGLNHVVNYGDCEAEDTIDGKLIIPSLRAKKEISHIIMGDKNRSWI